MYYIHKDYLGSYQTISNQSGNIAEVNGQQQVYAFDPWGRRRDPDTWVPYASTPSDLLFDRGFTGHEHLDAFALINMNGRVYDPLLGRFLSPDNYVQMPDYTQGLNRYTYGYNNPMVYTDPSGDNPLALLAIGMHLYIGGALMQQYGIYNNNSYLTQVGGIVQMGGSITMGFGFGGMGLPGMFGNAMISGMNNVMSGSSFERGFLSGVAISSIPYVLAGMGEGINALTQGYTGTIGDFIRKGLGHIPGIVYRNTGGMSSLAWVGIDLPKNIIPNISMSINGALSGTIGLKLILASTWKKTTLSLHESVNESSTLLINHQLLRKDGLITKDFSRVRLGYTGSEFDKYVLGSYNAGFTEMQGGNLGNGLGLTPWIRTNSYTFYRTIDLGIPDGVSRFRGARYIFQEVGVERYWNYERFGYPWWVKLFYGVGN